MKIDTTVVTLFSKPMDTGPLLAKYFELRGEMTWLSEFVGDAIDRIEDRLLQSELRDLLGQMADMRLESEFLVMGPEWARCVMEEDGWCQTHIERMLSRLFLSEVAQ